MFSNAAELQATPLTADDISKLSLSAQIALAARSALRVLPLCDPGFLKKGFDDLRNFDVITWFVLIAATHTDIKPLREWLSTAADIAAEASELGPLAAAPAPDYDENLNTVIENYYPASATIKTAEAIRDAIRAAARASLNERSNSVSGAVANAIENAARALIKTVNDFPYLAALSAVRQDYEWLLVSTDATPRNIPPFPLWSENVCVWGQIRERLDPALDRLASSGSTDEEREFAQTAVARLKKYLYVDFITLEEINNLEMMVQAWGKNFNLIWPNHSTSRQEPKGLSKDVPPPPTTPLGLATVNSDLAGTKDFLGRQHFAEALADLFASPFQPTPLTLALLGDWGAGKSTVLNLVEARLLGEMEPASGETLREKARLWLKRRLTPENVHIAKFNAWSYEQTANLPAGLAQEVVHALTRLSTPRAIWLRFQFAIAEHKYKFLRSLVYFAGAIAFGFLLAFWAYTKKASPVFAAIVDSFIEFAGNNPGTVFGTGAVASFSAATVLYQHFKKALADPLTGELYRYLQLPSYAEHLGLVPVLQRHIRTLCGLRLGVRMPWLAEKWGRRRPQANATRAKWIDHLFRPRRLVVFVDDLDRCSPENVVKTFEAIRLVMDIENVIVVVAIDERIAFRAIEEHYKKLADNERTPADIARDYLGKIIQVPIRLRSADEAGVQRFIADKLFAAMKPKEEDAKPDTKGGSPGIDANTDTVFATGQGGGTPPPVQDAKPSASLAKPTGQIAETESPQGTASTGNKSDAASTTPTTEVATTVTEMPKPREINRDAIMQDTGDELTEFQKWAALFEIRNPRQLTRLHSTFRLLKLLDEPPGPGFGWQKIMAMLFWQEFIHSNCKDRENLLFGLEQHVRATLGLSAGEEGNQENDQIAAFVRDYIMPRGRDPQQPTQARPPVKSSD